MKLTSAWLELSSIRVNGSNTAVESTKDGPSRVYGLSNDSFRVFHEFVGEITSSSNIQKAAHSAIQNANPIVPPDVDLWSFREWKLGSRVRREFCTRKNCGYPQPWNDAERSEVRSNCAARRSASVKTSTLCTALDAQSSSI